MRDGKMDGLSFDRKFDTDLNRNRYYNRLSMPFVDNPILEKELEERPSILTVKPNRTNPKLTPISFQSSD